MLRFLLLALLTVLSLFGCGKSDTPDPQPGQGLRILATTGMITQVTRQIVGPHAEVHGLMGSDVDPHLYQPTRSDVAAIERANLILFNGLHLESKLGTLLAKQSKRGKKVVAVGERLDRKLLLQSEDSSSIPDPHVWMDVSLWAKAVGHIRDVLAEADANHADDYRKRAGELLDQLDKLHAYGKKVLATVPKERRLLITAHDAFRYLERAYDLQVVGIQGVSTDSQAGLADIRRIVDLIVQRKVHAVFTENSIAQQGVQAILEGAQARGHKVTVGGTLYSDAMGPDDHYTGSYIGMMDHNFTVLSRALGGDAPPGGCFGKLAAPR